MKPIPVTPENRKQYLADCRADYLRENPPAPRIDFQFMHDRFMFGKIVFVPKSLLSYRFSKSELHALAH